MSSGRVQSPFITFSTHVPSTLRIKIFQVKCISRRLGKKCCTNECKKFLGVNSLTLQDRSNQKKGALRNPSIDRIIAGDGGALSIEVRGVEQESDQAKQETKLDERYSHQASCQLRFAPEVFRRRSLASGTHRHRSFRVYWPLMLVCPLQRKTLD